MSPGRLVELLDRVSSGVINVIKGKEVFRKMLSTDKSAGEITDEEKVDQIWNTRELQKVIDDVMDEFPEEVSRYRQGKKSLLSYFMGQVMRRTEGRSDPRMVRTLLSELLDSAERWGGRPDQMGHVILRSLQVLSLMVVLSGLYFGIRGQNLLLEIEAVASGAVLFYLAHWILNKWVK